MYKALSKQSQVILASLIDYFERERENGGFSLPLTDVRDRVADALKLSITTVNRIATKSNRSEVLSNPSKQQKRQKSAVDIDDLDQTIIRNVIYDMHKTNDLRHGLMELPSVAMKRIQFLHDNMKLKKDGLRQLVFLDETWVFKDGTIGRSWKDSNVKSVKKTKVDGARNKPTPSSSTVSLHVQSHWAYSVINKNFYRDTVRRDGTSADKSRAIWKEALDKATPDVWAETIRHTEQNKIILGLRIWVQQ